jgi:hypothetical protein
VTKTLVTSTPWIRPVMPPTTSNLDTTCPPRVPGATKICLRGA